jgi:hypothetical protein
MDDHMHVEEEKPVQYTFMDAVEMAVKNGVFMYRPYTHARIVCFVGKEGEYQFKNDFHRTTFTREDVLADDWEVDTEPY